MKPGAIVIKKGLAKRLRELRVERGLTQKELADKLGIEQNSISRFESGRYMPLIETLSDIAEALDSKLEFLITPKK